MLAYRGRSPGDEAEAAEEVRRFPTVLRHAALRDALSTVLRAAAAGLAILVALVLLFGLASAAPAFAWALAYALFALRTVILLAAAVDAIRRRGRPRVG